MLEKNIKVGFQATGLVPAFPERVLSTLTVVHTPSPPLAAAVAAAEWTAETLRTVSQLKQQV